MLIISISTSCQNETTYDPSKPYDTKVIDKLPKFNLRLLDSTTVISSRDIPKDGITIIIFFDPTCSHCQKELTALKDSIGFFIGARIALISPVSIQELSKSPLVKQFDGFKNVITAHDYNNAYKKYFNGTQVPMTVIYDKDLRLRTIFRGPAEISELKEQYLKVRKRPSMG